MSFGVSAKKYKESQKVKDAYDKYIQYQDTEKPADYVFSDGELLESAKNDYFNYAPFEYELEKDPLYAEYRDQYTKEGKRAMRDTVGNASALTGGYANSYAETAGYASYAQHLDKLNDVIPELYQAAYDTYSQELDRLEAKLGYLTDKDKDEYSRYLDSYNFYTDEVNALRQLYLQEYRNDMDIQDSEWEAAYKIAKAEQDKAIADAELGYKYHVANQNRLQWEQELAYKQQQDEYDRSLRELELRIQRQKVNNEHNEFLMTHEAEHGDKISESELYVILTQHGDYETVCALDLNYDDDETVRFKALSMGIDPAFVDSYFDAKYGG